MEWFCICSLFVSKKRKKKFCEMIVEVENPTYWDYFSRKKKRQREKKPISFWSKLSMENIF